MEFTLVINVGNSQRTVLEEWKIFSRAKDPIDFGAKIRQQKCPSHR